MRSAAAFDGAQIKIGANTLLLRFYWTRWDTIA